MGKRTGILFNNLMNNFTLPGSPSSYAPTREANCIVPGKRPLSSMSPTIITDKNGDVILVTGGSGGTKIINAVVQVYLAS